MTTAAGPFDALMHITARPPTVFVRGEGSWLWDDGGKHYLDFVQGWAVNCLGHSPPAVVEALATQAKLLLTPSPAFYNATSLSLAKALVDRSGFDQVFFTNSGAEANEGAISCNGFPRDMVWRGSRPRVAARTGSETPDCCIDRRAGV